MNDSHKIISGTKWITISTLTDTIIQILKISILARFLDKSDFGIIAIVNYVLGLTSTFADLGFSAVIMHKQDLTHKKFSSVYWMQFFIYCALFLVISLFSPLISNFYGEQSLNYLIPLSLLNLVFWGIGKLYDTILLKNMQYKLIATRNIVSVVLSLIVSVVLAWLNYGVYSLVLGTLLYTLINNIWNFIQGQKDCKIKFYFSLDDIKPLFMIGVYKTGTQILDYFSNRIDIMIIGKLLGMESLGIYNIAKDLLMKTSSIITSIIQKISLPILAKEQLDLNSLKNKFITIIKINSTIIYPLCVFVFIFSNEIITILYGKQFIEAAYLMKILTFLILLNSVVSPEGILVTSTGRTKLDFNWTIIRILLSIPIIILTCYHSIEALVLSQLLIALYGMYYIWRNIINKIINLPLKEYLQIFYKDFISVSITIVTISLLTINISSLFVNILVKFLSTICVYVACTVVLKNKEIYNLIFKYVKK